MERYNLTGQALRTIQRDVAQGRVVLRNSDAFRRGPEDIEPILGSPNVQWARITSPILLGANRYPGMLLTQYNAPTNSFADLDGTTIVSVSFPRGRVPTAANVAARTPFLVRQDQDAPDGTLEFICDEEPPGVSNPSNTGGTVGCALTLRSYDQWQFINFLANGNDGTLFTLTWDPLIDDAGFFDAQSHTFMIVPPGLAGWYTVTCVYYYGMDADAINFNAPDVLFGLWVNGGQIAGQDVVINLYSVSGVPPGTMPPVLQNVAQTLTTCIKLNVGDEVYAVMGANGLNSSHNGNLALADAEFRIYTSV
jgi:hypothetical protein